MTRISALTALTSADSGDTLPILDVSATTTKKITKTAFLSDIVDGTLITSQKILSRHVDISVADATARTALASPFEGMMCYQEDVDAIYIYDGSAWRRQAQWEELGRTTLTGNATSLTVSSLPARKYLTIIANWLPSGTLVPQIEFNGDTATNYCYNYSFNGGANATATAQTQGFLSPNNGVAIQGYTILDFVNITAQEKIGYGRQVDIGGASNVNYPSRTDFSLKWVNTSAQISSVLIKTTTNNFASGTSLIILGRD